MVFTLDFLCVDCIAKYQRRNSEVFLFHRIIKFTAQPRGLDFALVQARHSSKVITYFATKALSTYLFFWRILVWKSKAQQQETVKLSRNRPVRTRTNHLSPFGFPGWFLSQMLEGGSKIGQLEVQGPGIELHNVALMKISISVNQTFTKTTATSNWWNFWELEKTLLKKKQLVVLFLQSPACFHSALLFQSGI